MTAMTSSLPDPATLRHALHRLHRAPEAEVLAGLCATPPLSPEARKAASATAAGWVERMRADTRPGLMEVFLAEYGLSTEEGVASCAWPRRCCACPMPRPSTR
jgi:RHH-type proline utilization regulon transcriptional repressor/proline dehydrogenase/delta 1-pyrroline-5-carboxylate dehydrogenase